MALIHAYHQAFSGGIGDFLRGSIYLHQLCKYNKIPMYIDWNNHQIGKYIGSHKPQVIPKYSLEYVLDIEELALKSPGYKHLEFSIRMEKIISFILDSISNSSNDNVVMSSFFLDIYSSNNPLQKILKYKIHKTTKKYIQNNMHICKSIKKLQSKICRHKEYGTIHFRLGDRHTLAQIDEKIDSLPDKIKNNYNLMSVDHDYDYLYHLILQHIENNNFNHILLLSDSNDFKRYVYQHKNKKIIIPHYQSNHAASGPGLLKFSDYKNEYSDDHAKHTAIDLEILINSQKNITYSIYNWGSGFSIWPSKIFNIPLEAFHLNYQPTTI